MSTMTDAQFNLVLRVRQLVYELDGHSYLEADWSRFESFATVCNFESIASYNQEEYACFFEDFIGKFLAQRWHTYCFDRPFFEDLYDAFELIGDNLSDATLLEEFFDDWSYWSEDQQAVFMAIVCDEPSDFDRACDRVDDENFYVTSADRYGEVDEHYVQEDIGYAMADLLDIHCDLDPNCIQVRYFDYRMWGQDLRLGGEYDFIWSHILDRWIALPNY